MQQPSMPEKRDTRSKRNQRDKRTKQDKPGKPGKPDLVFNVPPEVKKAQQSGWVYRSGGKKAQRAPAVPAPKPPARDPAPAASERGVATRAASRPSPVRTGVPSSWITDLLVLPFSVPLCLIVSLLPRAARRDFSK
jgi:hypothetical protein